MKRQEVMSYQSTQDAKSMLANEPSVAYIPAYTPSFHMTSLQNLSKGLEYDWDDDNRVFNLVSYIRKGMEFKSFKHLTSSFPLDDAEWAKIMGLTTRTLDRYKKDNKKFGPRPTERIFEIILLMNFGKEVFEEEYRFFEWLSASNVGLGGTSPRDLLDTSIGVSMVKDALGRIAHGIFA